MPSMLMLRTPARSETISPIPASSSGVASRIEEPRNTANSSQVISPLPFLDEQRSARERDHDQALDHHDEGRGHGGDHFHVDAAGSHEAEQQRCRRHAGHGAARQQPGDEAVKSIAGRKAVLQGVLLAEQHQRAREAAKRAR